MRSVPRCVSTSRACAWLRALFFTPDPRQMGRAVPLGEGRFLAPLFPSHRPPPCSWVPGHHPWVQAPGFAPPALLSSAASLHRGTQDAASAVIMLLPATLGESASW